MVRYSLLITGVGPVGKSAVFNRITDNKFEENYRPTEDNSKTVNFEIDDDICTTEITDTHTTGEFTAMRDLHFKNCDGVILIFSIDSRQSFDDIPNELEQIRRVKDRDDFPLVLLGNKCDLENLREVPTSEGKEMADLIKCDFFEVSAKDNIQITDAFATLMAKVNREKPKPRKTNFCAHQ